ncbi:MAG: hypothetical protein WDN06_16395 [Asticcacaulis sp.]
MRCFALAEAARAQDIAVTFLLNELDRAVAERIAEIGADGQATFLPVAAPGDLEDMDFQRDDWLMIDSYDATADYIAALHNRLRVGVMDDLNALDHFDCDVLINPAMVAAEMGYERKTKARLLLGAPYALIRGEFTKTYPPSSEGPSLAVMFGGSDPAGLTGVVAEILHDALPDMIVKVIAGPANTHTNTLIDLSKRLQNMRLWVSPPSVAAVLAGSDLVVTAAGGSIGEVAAMALPALVLVVYDNQKAALAACPVPSDRCPRRSAGRSGGEGCGADGRPSRTRPNHRRRP